MGKSTNLEFSFSTELDQTFLQTLYEDDLAYASEVFENFLIDTKKEFEELKKSYGEDNVKEIRQKLHKIKPTFAFVGITSLPEKIEKVIIDCDHAENISETEPGYSELLSTIEKSFRLVETELERIKSYMA
jgi:hypothetical protein